MKKQLIASITSLAILSATPFNVLATDSWKNVNVNETNVEQGGSLFNSENYDFVKYSHIEKKLQQVAKESKRVTYEKSTYTSSKGEPMYVVTISNPDAKGKFGYYKGLRKKMLKSPEKAQDFIDKHPDLKVPVMINGSIHGTEFIGTDAVLQLIERFATQNDQETNAILEDHILIFNVVANPDGRIDATRFNGNGIDLNRDFITQSQAETKHTVDLITEWNPMVFLDLHGYVKGYGGPSKPGLIEPCTPPHNPNYEYDLFSKWSLDQAKSMESEIVSQRDHYENTNTSTSKVDYQNMEGTYIPLRDDTAGWDDYPPIFTPMYAMYHGAYGYTLEAPTNDWDGVKWTYDAVMGALKFSSNNKTDMVKDQIEIFKRGVNFDHPFHQEGFFPKAYILPENDLDNSTLQKAVKHLLDNDIEVTEAKKEFSYNGKTYQGGSYIVWLDQAKAGLANTMLWDGENITEDTPAMYDISAWSLPELWGFEAVEVNAKDSFSVKTSKVTAIQTKGTLNGNGPYLIPNSSVQSVSLANQLINKGFSLNRDNDGNFYVSADAKSELSNLLTKVDVTVDTKIIPNDAQKVGRQVVTILRDGGMNKSQSHSGTHLALKRLGFIVEERTPREIAENGIGDTDVFIYNGTSRLISYQNSNANKEFGLENVAQYEKFKKHINEFVDNSGKFVALGAGGSQAATQLGLTSIVTKTGGSSSNGIVKVDYKDSPFTAGYQQNDLGFVYYPAWYSNVGSAEVLANYEATEDFFAAGHWKDYQQAQGQPVMVKDENVLLVGMEPGFRDHTDFLFRIISNAVYSK
ncbi:M14 family zinc carboxypeptidase [Metabacillus herbersteinensis]|uniref:M14 family zinc carboxypeptidase n=1 Tax=Metabacillus herbersteinensis TaxID=283816 RepID=A0ABV6GAX0_9BACI